MGNCGPTVLRPASFGPAKPQSIWVRPPVAVEVGRLFSTLWPGSRERGSAHRADCGSRPTHPRVMTDRSPTSNDHRGNFRAPTDAWRRCLLWGNNGGVFG